MPKNDQLIQTNGAQANSIPVPDDAQTEIRALHQGVLQKYLAVGQIDYQLALLEAQKTDLIRAIKADEDAKAKRCTEAAKEVGLSPDDPSKGRWNIDLTSPQMAFQRVG